MATHRRSRTISAGSAKITEQVSEITTADANLDLDVLNTASDEQVSIFVESTNLKSFHLLADQSMTVKTNSSGAPQETFNLTANVAYTWMTGDAGAPIAGDVTQIFVTNNTADDGNLKLIAGWD